MTITANIDQQLQQQFPFVAYRKPNSNDVILISQQDDKLYEVENFEEQGFVFANFDLSQQILIPKNKSKMLVFSHSNNNVKQVLKRDFIEDEADKIAFTSMVKKAITAIENKDFKKVVLSRNETIVLENKKGIDIFEKLLDLYATAFCYYFYHPKVGTWLGATPEKLLEISNYNFETISLAGTQKNTGIETIVWQEKELQEQQLVTDYIVSKIEKHSYNLKISTPFNAKAGNLWHLKTIISAELNQATDLKQMVTLLHPTPAVCGYPKEKALVFIINNENYKRDFYSGFLGELNLENTNKTVFYVNLRCLQLQENTAILYAGCGITNGSQADKEWEETCNKTQTIKNALL
jgi:isochorismate synthase